MARAAIDRPHGERVAELMVGLHVQRAWVWLSAISGALKAFTEASGAAGLTTTPFAFQELNHWTFLHFCQ